MVIPLPNGVITNGFYIPKEFTNVVNPMVYINLP